MVIIVLVNCSSILGSDNIRQLIYELVVDKVLPNTTKWRISTKKYATFLTIMIGIEGDSQMIIISTARIPHILPISR